MSGVVSGPNPCLCLATRTVLGDANWNVVTRLADARLLITGHDLATGQETAEVIHEALIQHWHRLRYWIEADHKFLLWLDSLRIALHQWEKSGKDTSVLLRGILLNEALNWLSERRDVISEREQAFILASLQLWQQNSEFTAISNHELRTPLTVIQGLTQLLIRLMRRQENQGQLPIWMRHYINSLETIERETKRLITLMSWMLDAVEVQSGMLVLHRKSVDLLVLISEVVQRWRASQSNPPLQVDIDLQGEEVSAHWDAHRVEQILHILLNNALKSGTQGGVTLRARLDSQRSSVIISVQDEGIGIPAEALSLVFMPFYRAEHRGSIRGGIDFGLYVSQHLANAHGGNLWAESPGVGKGSTFYLQLPLEPS